MGTIESKNIGIFIDYDNVYLMLEKYYETYNNSNLKIEVISALKDKFKNEKIITTKAFADFQKINPYLTELQKCQVELRHVYSNNNSRKNASDISMVIDVVKSIYSKNLISKYIIVSSDSDMLPIINEIRYFGKEISVVYSKYGSIDGYENYLDKDDCITLESILGIDSVYKPIEESEITENLGKYLNIINDYINQVKDKHSGRGTCSIKDIRENLWTKSLMVYNDVDRVIEYLLRHKMLFEFFIGYDRKYSKIAIDSNVLNSKNITLDNNIIDFSKVFDLINCKK